MYQSIKNRLKIELDDIKKLGRYKNERIIGFLKIGYPEIIPKKVKKPISDVRFYLP